MSIKEKSTDKKLISGLSWSFAEKFATDIVEAVVGMVLARLLLPKDYGMVNLIQIFITISSIFVNTGLSNALIQKKDINERQLSTAFYFNLLVGLVIYTALFFLAPAIVKYKNGNGELLYLIRVLAIKIPISSIYSIQHAYIKRKMDFKLFFFSSLAGTIAAGVVGVYLAYKGYGAWALIISTLTDQVMDCIILFITSGWFPKFCFSLKETFPIIKFGGELLVSELLSRTYGQCRSLLQGLKYSTEDLAFDYKGKKFPNMVISTVDPSITRVILPFFSSKQDDKEDMRNSLARTIRFYSFFICPTMIGMAVTAKTFIPLLLTDNWLMCVPYVVIYCVSVMLNSIVGHDDKIIQAFGEGKTIIKVNTINMLADIAIIIPIIFFYNNPKSLAYSSILSSIINILVYSSETNRLIKYSAIDHIKDFLPQLFCALLMGAVVTIPSFFIERSFLLLSIQIITGVVFYGILSLAIKLEPAMNIVRLIKKRLS